MPSVEQRAGKIIERQHWEGFISAIEMIEAYGYSPLKIDNWKRVAKRRIQKLNEECS